MGLSRMSVNQPTPFEIHRLLVEMFTSQLVSHGAILFASLTPAIGLLGAYLFRRRNGSITVGVKIISVLVLGSLLGITFYTFWRIYYYGQLINTLVRYSPAGNHTFQSYYEIVNNQTVRTMGNITLLGINPSWFVRPAHTQGSMILSLVIGFVSGLLLVLGGDTKNLPSICWKIRFDLLVILGSTLVLIGALVYGNQQSPPLGFWSLTLVGSGMLFIGIFFWWYFLRKRLRLERKGGLNEAHEATK